MIALKRRVDGAHYRDCAFIIGADHDAIRPTRIATIDPHGYVKITDRIKDLVKSGGEWISSIDVENALISHPAVQEVAVIAVPHPKWGERPLAIVVAAPGETPTQEALDAHLAQRVAAFARPDAYAFVNELPKTSTGKLMKSALRETYRDWQWT